MHRTKMDEMSGHELEVASSGQQFDLESQQLTHHEVLVISTPRIRRWVYAIVIVRKLLFSVRLRSHKANKGNQHQPLLSYVALPITHVIPESAEVVTSSSTDIPSALADDHDHARVDIAEEETNTSNSTISTSTTAAADAKRLRFEVAEIVKTKNLHSLHQFGGIKRIAEVFNTNLQEGIPGHEEDLRSRTAQTNSVLPKSQATEAKPSPGFFGILLRHCNDAPIFLLSIAAVLSIGFGIKKDGIKTGWYEGFFIMVGIIILVLAPTLRDLWLLKRSHIFKRNPELLEQKLVNVIRASCKQEVSISKVIEGDVVVLKTGCLVPADGLLVRGEFLVVHDGSRSAVDKEDPFLFHGSVVTSGEGRMLVTTVGADTVFSKLMSSVAAGQTPNRTTSLPAQLDKLRKVMHIVALLLSIIILIVLFVRNMVHTKFDSDTDLPELKGKHTASKDIMDIVERIIMKPRGKIGTNIVSFLTVMVGVMEGIPFVITLASILWRKKMMSNKASDPGLLATVTMGSATTIFTDKTPLNPTDVAMCFVGTDEAIKSADFKIAEMPKIVREALADGISAPLMMPSSPRKLIEDPLVPWAASNLGIKLDTSRLSCTVMKTNGLSSNEEGSGVLMKRNTEREILSLHFKGPATTILGKCSSYYDSSGETNALDEEKRDIFEKNIEKMQSQDLKIVAFACKQIDDPVVEENDFVEENDLILIAMVGLKKYTCSAEIKETLKGFKEANVKIRLVSEDDVSELQEIATACEILPPDGLVIKGEDFRNYNEQERMDKADKIYVMGNSDLADRILLMQCLKEKGNVVVSLGSTTSDTPMLRKADIGVAMGTWSSQMVIESADFIVFDGSLRSLLTVTSCGRCTYHNIRKYIQLELVTNIAGTLIASITTMWLGSNSITGFQLIWTNLVTTLVAGPALMMEPPKNELMHKPPIRPTEPLISRPMWRNIVIQVLYQTTILVTFQFKGQALLGFIHITKQHVSKSMIFSSFVHCQIFNQLNSRELEKINVFKGIHRNPWFSLAVVFILGLQVSFIEVAHVLVGDERLDLVQWCVCLFIGAVSCPVDAAAKGAWKLIKLRHFGSHIGSATMTHSTSSDSVSNLELPLMTSTANSTSDPS